MTGRDRYPTPFEQGGSSCSLTCSATIGPCHTTSPERQDVSAGWDGLPVRLALRVVDASCNPIPGAIVEIWHTNYQGGYSGNIQAMCTKEKGDADKDFFRGYQRCDGRGVVQFDTVFPGWYRGRAVHIHFRVMTGSNDGADNATAAVVSQLFFPPDLVQAVFDKQVLYRDFGQPDTSLETDNVVGGEDDPTPFIVDVERLEDGAMLAAKTIVIAEGKSCQMRGADGGPGGPGGPPPGGPGGPPLPPPGAAAEAAPARRSSL
jgi:protocatechuate 3,4-dioxygenase beta subunit